MTTAVRGMPVRIQGQWRSRSPWTWEGLATADKPFSGIAMILSRESIHWCKASRCQARDMAVIVTIRPYDAAGHDVQVNLQIGSRDGHRAVRTMLSDVEAAFQFRQEAFTSGSMFWFCDVGGQPPLRLGALCISDQDLLSGRSGIWRVRHGHYVTDHCAAAVLSRGRSGVIPASGITL